MKPVIKVVAQKNDGSQLWPQRTWIPEAASLPKVNRNRNAADE